MRKLIMSAVLILTSAVLLPVPVSAEGPAEASPTLREAVTVDGIRAHQAAFQTAADNNNGVRASGTAGYDESADYVQAQLEAAGYDVDRIEFDFDFFSVVGDPVFERTAPESTVYVDQTDFDVMSFSGSGEVVDTAVTPVDLALDDPESSTSGCEAEDFDATVAGTVALMQRGACSFAQKVTNAEAAGAVAAIVVNQGNTEDREGLLFGTLGGPGAAIPAVGTTFALAEILAAEGSAVSLDVETLSDTRTTTNVVAQTKTGGTDDVVMLGAHLDSVPEGPGIQDNGSGSGAILEMAIQLQAQFGVNDDGDDSLTNAVRFGWWGAEESGLLGSIDYVTNLSQEEIDQIGVYLNFDMIGSPNFVRFVYDGDGSDIAPTIDLPAQSATVERVFLDYFADQGLETEATVIGQRSDHFAFCVSGVPCGGLFTGAEGIKTAEQVAVYGGTEGEQYDQCYHQECDTFDNISLTALDQMSDAAAHSLAIYAFTPICNGLPATIVGSDRADTIRGTNRNDVIATLGGRDNVDGRGGDDTICLGDGADTANGNRGNDTIIGGGGSDDINGNGGDDDIRSGAGADTVNGGAGDDIIDTGVGADTVRGGGGNDTISSGDGSDDVSGNGGDDVVDAGNGADVVAGGGGADSLAGGAGPDDIKGNGGDDSLDGGEGRDTLNGGGGTDVCMNGEIISRCESTTGFPPPALRALTAANAAAGGGASSGGAMSAPDHEGSVEM